MEFIDVVESRRSVRKFYPKPVEMEKIGAIITAGSIAPSVGDLQPWRFLVVTKAKQLQAVADGCPYERWLYQAPLLIVICALSDKTERYYPGKGKEWASQSCAAAGQSMLLAAVDLELAGCWVSSFESQKVRDALRIPGGIDPEIILAIGYADETPPKRRTLPLSVTTFFNSFGEKSVDLALFKKDYGLYFRGKAEDATSRIAYETAEGGRLRGAADRVQGAFDRFVSRLRGKKRGSHPNDRHHQDHKKDGSGGNH